MPTFHITERLQRNNACKPHSVWSPFPLPFDTKQPFFDAGARGLLGCKCCPGGAVRCAGSPRPHSGIPRTRRAGGHWRGGRRSIWDGSGRRLRSSDLPVPSQEVESAGIEPCQGWVLAARSRWMPKWVSPFFLVFSCTRELNSLVGLAFNFFF